VNEYEKEEFWKALGRLYDASVALQHASEALRLTAEAHEHRLDKIEVVQEWLARKEREREKGQQ
jgi:hypothetical protein